MTSNSSLPLGISLHRSFGVLGTGSEFAIRAILHMKIGVLRKIADVVV